jgi:hypothetical protein
MEFLCLEEGEAYGGEVSGNRVLDMEHVSPLSPPPPHPRALHSLAIQESCLVKLTAPPPPPPPTRPFLSSSPSLPTFFTYLPYTLP